MNRGGPEVKAIFIEAIDREQGDERSGYLDAACMGDDELRRRIDALLRAHEQVSEILGASREPTPEASTQAEAAASSFESEPTATLDVANGPDGDGLAVGGAVRYFGDYEIQAELGRGGMGLVYQARQISLNRPVALKMLRTGLLADVEDLRRFQNEAEAVALLDHPGIVPIYEVGRHDGRRYLSMKFVRGGNLAERLDAYKDDPRGAAALVAEAAEAVHHAHMRGILHRDLKPANILVDAEGHAHVTDFGLAKRVQVDVELTLSGTILGTPGYMSPEQAAGRRGTITTATDVYGLGAVLYALLTGKAPFVGEDVLETLQNVREQPPEPPRRSSPKLSRDLEVICLKCLEKDPRRRYASAQALADDLSAWLDSRPIAARPVDPLTRAALWCRRRPAVAGLSAATVVVAMAGLSFGAWQWSIALRNAQAASLSSQAALRNARAARHSARIARDSADYLMNEIATVDLADLPQLAPVRTILLDKARRAYERLLAVSSNWDDAERNWLSARSQGRLGDIRAMLGQYRDAEGLYRIAIGRLGSLAAENPAAARSGPDEAEEDLGRSLLGDLVRARLGLAVLLKDTYRLDEAREEMRRAAADARKLEDARDASDRELIAAVEYEKGALLAKDAMLRGSLALESEIREGVETSMRAIRGQEALLERRAAEGAGGANPTRDLVRQWTALGRYRNDLGILLEATGQAEAAEQEFRRVLETIPATERSPGLRWRRARAAQNLGALLISHPRRAPAEGLRSGADEGRRHIETAIDLLADLRREFPEVPQYATELADAYSNLGQIEMRAKRFDRALVDLHQAAELSDQLVDGYPTVPSYHIQSARLFRLVAGILLSRGDAAKAEESARKAIDRLTSLRKLYPDMPVYLGESLGIAYQLSASSLHAMGQVEGARDAIEQAVGYHRKALGSSPDSPRYRHYLWMDYSLSPYIRVNLGDLAGAARDAEELPQLLPDNAASYTQSAYTLIQCGEKASADQKAHFYDRAIEQLREGVHRRILGRRQLQQPALEVLRDREGFRRLLESLPREVAG